MRLAAYLSRSRHGVYYFRWPIPARLHPDRKRGHVRLSLRTRCPATARQLSRMLALSGEAVTCLLTGQPEIAVTSGQGPVRQGPRSGKPMRYDEIRQHVQEHFRDALDRFKDGIAEAGPPAPARQAALETTQALAGADPESWAGMVHPDGAPGLVRAFCASRSIPEADLSDGNRVWLLDSLRQGYQAYAEGG